MDNDFRSLELMKPFVILGRVETAVYRGLLWNPPAVQNGKLVRRPADPSQNEIQYGSYIIRHPLKIDGVVRPSLGKAYLWWNSRGYFQGVSDYYGISAEHLPILINYAERCMGLHNFDFWKVVNDG